MTVSSKYTYPTTAEEQPVALAELEHLEGLADRIHTAYDAIRHGISESGIVMLSPANLNIQSCIIDHGYQSV